MTVSTMTCDCCGGDLPMREVWEARRDGPGECDGSVDGLRCRAFDADDWALNDMAEMLLCHGERFSGNNVADEAQEWIGHDFTTGDAGGWCEVGVWDAATAAEFRDAGLSPKDVVAAAERLTDGLDDPTEEYTDGDPIYSACNGDTSVQVIIDAASEE